VVTALVQPESTSPFSVNMFGFDQFAAAPAYCRYFGRNLGSYVKCKPRAARLPL
jgi:hypothetical protein